MRISFVRLGVVVTIGLVAAVSAGTPAWAHVEVSADKPQAGATNVTVTFSGEAESTTAGIRSEQVFFPASIPPQQVRLVSAPAGWTLTAAADNVTVSGPALPTGTDAEFALLIAQLPTDATEVVFKTLETYGDGTVSRWIELQPAGQPEPEHPAPTLKLSGAVTAPSSAATSAPTTPASSSTTASSTGADTGRGSVWIVVGVILVILAAGAIVVSTVVRRRRNPPTA